mgnify:CR=1 FL=1
MKPISSRGFSIVELLIAVALSMILTLGLIRVFTSSKQGYRVQESRSRMQENGRFAMDYLTRAIRLSDYWSSARPENIRIETTAPFVSACGLALQTGALANLVEGIRGFNGAASTSGIPADCAEDRTANSDAILLRYADPDTAATAGADLDTTKTNLSTAGNDNGAIFLRVLTGGIGVLFDAKNTTVLDNALSNPADSYAGSSVERPGNIINYKYRTELFYLRRRDASDATLPPSLYYSRNIYRTTPTPAGSAMVATELVEGIEMMKFEYGIDTDNDLLVDGYRPAASITNWSQVMSVRVGLIVLGDAREQFADASSYTMPGGYAHTVPTGFTGFQRFQFVREVQIRNRTTAR